MTTTIPTGTVTFLFTDIEGSTQLAQEYAETWESLRGQHDLIVRGAIEAQDGYVFRTVGDAFCAAFPTAGDALRAALRSQAGLQTDRGGGPLIKVRMGIHTGPAEIQADGDYQGYLTLTRVQRVMSAAHGGQILLSNAAAELVRGDLPEGVSLLDKKEHRLKGLQAPEHLWQVAAPGLPQGFPPLETLAETPHNLPVQLTSFVGRQQELADLRQEIRRQRLVTLTGPGGIGKTRLSLETARSLVEEFPHGAWFVELAHETDPARVSAAIARVFSLQEVSGRKIADILKDYLRGKELLLVLDNFEQVVEAAPLVRELLTACPHLKIMVTSRTPLRISGEHEYRVPLLPLPEQEDPWSVDRLAQSGSVQLFVERARSARADFTLTSENAQAIAATCRQLDGLPLAIELAAARVRVLTPQSMLGQLHNRLKFLVSPARDLPARQRTLRGAIAWSYDLLTPEEQTLFRQMAVFMGGATFEAVESVCDTGDPLDLLSELESLIDKNLVRQAEQDGETRYVMLEIIRDFADEMLVASGEAGRLQSRHLNHYHALARLAEPHLVGPDEMLWTGRLRAEHDNLRAASVWGLQNDVETTVEMLCDLALFWSRGGHNEEVIGWLHLALSHPALAADRAMGLRGRALLTLGILMLQQEYPEAASTLREAIHLLRQSDRKEDLAAALAFAGFLGDLAAADESVRIARTLPNKWLLAYSLVWQSQAIRAAGGDLQAARRSAAEGAALSREIGSSWAVARAVFSQGQLAAALGELQEARACLEECVERFTQSQDRYHANMARTELAHIERRQGNAVKALELFKESLRVWQDLGLQAAVAQQLECIAVLAAKEGKHQEAARLMGAARKLRSQTGPSLPQNDSLENERIFEAICSPLEPDALAASLAAGQAMRMPDAVAFALAFTLAERPSSP